MAEQKIPGVESVAIDNVMHVDTEPAVTDEVAGYIEKVELAAEVPTISLPTQVPTDDATLVPTVSIQVPDDAVILPMTQAQFEQGLQEQVVSSARWAAEWSVLMIKKYGAKVFFKG